MAAGRVNATRKLGARSDIHGDADQLFDRAARFDPFDREVLHAAGEAYDPSLPTSLEAAGRLRERPHHAFSRLPAVRETAQAPVR